MIQVELIRHGETVYHTLHQYLGRLDAPLSERGETLLKEDDRSLRKVYVSCRKRAIRTAQLLFPRAELIIVPGIEEMDFGVFEGRSADEMADEDNPSG